MQKMKLLDQKHILDTIEKGEPIELSFPTMDSTIQDGIHFLVDTILKKYNRPDMKECIYTALKELIINGIKANVKHTLFVENGINPNDKESLLKGLDLLKELMTENNLEVMEKKAVEKNLFVSVSIMHSIERIIILVENNTVLTELEDKRIREKFDSALQYESIADYYINNLDDSEGQGIGITMIVLMLKSQNIDPHAFTIDVKNKETTRAKIDFPFEEPPTLLRDLKN